MTREITDVARHDCTRSTRVKEFFAEDAVRLSNFIVESGQLEVANTGSQPPPYRISLHGNRLLRTAHHQRRLST